MRFTPLLQAATAVLLAGCNSITHICTLMVCEDALNVAFDQAPAGPVRVEVFADGAATPRVFDCADPALCPAGVYFTGLMAERVTVRVVTAGATYTQEFAPVYETIYPNGRDCGGHCEQATVTMDL